MKGNQWARLLAYVTGLVNQELLVQNELLSAKIPFSPFGSHVTPRNV